MRIFNFLKYIKPFFFLDYEEDNHYDLNIEYLSDREMKIEIKDRLFNQVNNYIFNDLIGIFFAEFGQYSIYYDKKNDNNISLVIYSEGKMMYSNVVAYGEDIFNITSSYEFLHLLEYKRNNFEEIKVLETHFGE